MALEIATHINDLVITNPAGGDDLGQGDDHLRLLKDVLKRDLPMTAAATASGLSVLQGTANVGADALGAFRRGTLLGTVSQTAGVPTGAVIERGSNANGEYVRFADGTQICTCQLIINASVAAGAQVIPGWGVPAAFSGTYSLIGEVIFFTAASAAGNAIYGVAFGFSTGTFLNTGRDSSALAASFTLGTTAALSYTYKAMAIGRWF